MYVCKREKETVRERDRQKNTETQRETEVVINYLKESQLNANANSKPICIEYHIFVR